MEFNKDCARDILFYVKQNCCYQDSNFGKRWHDVSFDEICKAEQFSKYEPQTISYAIDILLDHCLIKKGKLSFNSNVDEGLENIHINSLTSRGHEFIDNVSSDELWDKVKIAIKNANVNDCSLDMYFQYIYNETQKSLNG